MTCIVGLVEKGEVWLGADSAGVDGLSVCGMSSRKMFGCGDEILIGCAGSLRLRDLLQYSFDPPPINTRDLYEYVVRDFVEAVRNLMKSSGMSAVENNVEGIGSAILVGVRGRLFTIQDDLAVIEQNVPYHAIGCGGEIACGSLFSTHGLKMRPKERLMRALKASARYSGGVCAPFTVKAL